MAKNNSFINRRKRYERLLADFASKEGVRVLKPEAIALSTFDMLVGGTMMPEEVCHSYVMASKEDEKKVESALEHLRRISDSPISQKYTDQELDPLRIFFHKYNQV